MVVLCQAQNIPLSVSNLSVSVWCHGNYVEKLNIFFFWLKYDLHIFSLSLHPKPSVNHFSPGFALHQVSQPLGLREQKRVALIILNSRFPKSWWAGGYTESTSWDLGVLFLQDCSLLSWRINEADSPCLPWLTQCREFYAECHTSVQLLARLKESAGQQITGRVKDPDIVNGLCAIKYLILEDL